MTAGYSALFSAGLLAPSGFAPTPKTPTSKPSKSPSNALHVPLGDSSPIRPVSPLPRARTTSSHSSVHTSSSTDTDTDVDMSDAEDFKRDITPTQQSVTSARARAGSGSGSSGNGTMPRLRRRRSSLTMAASSPMNVIRSPIRTAGNALQLQRVMNRSRSGSLASSPPTETVFNFFGAGGGAGAGDAQGPTTTTSIMGRLRSGSVGTSLGSSRPPPPAGAAHSRMRRYARRTASVAGAPLPPPTAPLPDVPPPVPPLPSSLSTLKLSMPPLPRRGSLSFRGDAPKATTTPGGGVKPTRPGRDRGMSVSSGSVETIDEDMREL